MPSCAFYRCKNSSKTKNKLQGITFHRFPHEELWKLKWLQIVRKQRQEPEWQPTNYSRLCSSHFKAEDMYTTHKGYRKISQTALPYFRLPTGMEDMMKECEHTRNWSEGTSSTNDENEVTTNNSTNDKEIVEIEISKVIKEEPMEQDTLHFERVEVREIHPEGPEVNSNNIKSEIKEEPTEEDTNAFDNIEMKIEENPVVAPNGLSDVVECVPATSHNLPKVNMFAIVELFAMKPSYRSLDYDKIKQETGINTGDDSIGCVKVHKHNTKYTIQGTVAFNTTESHTCVVKYEEREKIIEYTSCDCQNSACEHVIAFVMWLHRRTEERIHTNIKYNLSPKIQESQLVTAKQGCDNNTDSETQPASDKNQVLNQCLAVCKDKLIISPLVSHFSDENPTNKTSLHKLICQAEEVNIKDADEFIEFCRVNVNSRDCAEAARVTSHNKHTQQQLQYGRIAHDLLYDVTQASDQQNNIQPLLDKILMPRVREKDILHEQIIDIVKRKLKLEVTRCGLLLSDKYPIFCGSPYGVTDDHVLDVAYVKDDETIEDYVEDDSLKEKINARLLLFMLLAKKPKAYFFLGNKDLKKCKLIQIHEYSFNSKLCTQLISKCTEFWKENVFKGKLSNSV